jgi:hypothetical protein
MSKIITEEQRQEILARSVSSPGPKMALRPQSFGELMQFAEMASRSTMVPKDFQGKPENIMLAVQMGSELGLAPMQSLANIAIVNGRAAVWGDALPGLCRQSGLCQSIREWTEGEGDNMTAYCEAIRVGSAPIVQSFSVDDAKRAGLWKDSPKLRRQSRDGGSYEVDSGPWYSYPKRMLQMRARGFALRDAFPDVLRGLISAEEARDIPVDNFKGTTINAESATAPEEAAHASPDRVVDTAPRPKKTIGHVLGEWETKVTDALAGPSPQADVDAIFGSGEFRKAEDLFTNGALERLNQIKQMAFTQLAEIQERESADETGEGA